MLRTLLKRVSVSRRKVASFLAGTKYQSDHLAEFCRKCSLCFRTIAMRLSGNPACSIREVARDSGSSTRLGTHRYSGDGSQSGCGTQANTYPDKTRSQGASSDPGEGSLARRPPKTSRDTRRALGPPRHFPFPPDPPRWTEQQERVCALCGWPGARSRPLRRDKRLSKQSSPEIAQTPSSSVNVKGRP